MRAWPAPQGEADKDAVVAHCLNEFKAKFAFFVAHIQASRFVFGVWLGSQPMAECADSGGLATPVAPRLGAGECAQWGCVM